MNLILLGPPGSGKGTQSRFLAERLGVAAISTGEMLREACRQKSALGLKAEKYIGMGMLVPDNVVIEIVKERLHHVDCQRGFILDGFPRTLKQAEALTEFLLHEGHGLDAVLNLEIHHEELVRRLTGRRLCHPCGAAYHLVYSPPRREALCNRCGGDLYQREDDREETIEKRLVIYQKETAPLIDYYRRQGKLKTIAALGGTGEVLDRILVALEAEGGARDEKGKARAS